MVYEGRGASSAEAQGNAAKAYEGRGGLHGDMSPKMKEAGEVVDQYAGAGIYLSLAIEENASSTFVARDGELSDRRNGMEKGARVHAVAYDEEGKAWEVYGITQDTSQTGLQRLADYAVKTLQSGDAIESLSQNFTAAAASGVYLSIPRKIYVFKNESKVEDHYEVPASKPFDSVSDKQKASLVEELSSSAMRDGIVHASGIYSEGQRRSWFLDTNGSRISQVIPRPYAGVEATAQKDDPEYETIDFTNFDSFGLGEGGYELVAKALKDKDAKERGAAVAEGAVRTINGERFNAGTTTVVMDGKMAGVLIHEALGHMTEADQYTKEDSRILKGKLGERIAVEGLNVVDDGRALQTGMLSGKGRGSYKYDDEGTPSQRTELIKDGVLTNYLMGNNEAAKYNQRELNEFMKKQGYGESTFDLAKELEKEVKSAVMDFTKSYMADKGGAKEATDEQAAMYLMQHQQDAAFQAALATELQKVQQDVSAKVVAKSKEIQDAWEKADKREYASTGNARAEAWYAVPQVRMTNTMILPNEKGTGVEEMAAGVKDGIYMAGSWGGYVDLAGNFAFWPKEAYKIQDGKIQYDKPVKGVILMDNTLKALKNISAIGNESTYDRFGGTCGKGGQGVPNECSGPAVRIDDIVVQGTPFDKVGHQATSAEGIKAAIEEHGGMYLGPEVGDAKRVSGLKTPWDKK